MGWGNGDGVKIVAFIGVAGIIVLAGVLGFDLIMRLQAVLTIALAALTAGYVLFTMHRIDWQAIVSAPGGSDQSAVGVFVFVMAGFGLGWVNSASDYSRYLPRKSSSFGVMFLSHS